MSATASDWVSCREAQRIGGFSRSDVHRLSMAGRLRTRALPGETVKFHAGDIRRLAAERQQPTAA
jgi:hypothetical protein